jgi:hypothetical protein
MQAEVRLYPKFDRRLAILSGTLEPNFKWMQMGKIVSLALVHELFPLHGPKTPLPTIEPS